MGSSKLPPKVGVFRVVLQQRYLGQGTYIHRWVVAVVAGRERAGQYSGEVLWRY